MGRVQTQAKPRLALWLLPAFLCAHIFISRETSGYEAAEKYSPKSCVVNFDTQMSSSQSEEWTIVFTLEENDTSNQNRERCFFTCEKNDTSNQKPQKCVSFAPKFPPFIAACSAASHRFNEKVLLKEFFSLKKWKTFRKWSGIVSFVSLSIKKTVESRRNNSGKG